MLAGSPQRDTFYEAVRSTSLISFILYDLDKIKFASFSPFAWRDLSNMLILTWICGQKKCQNEAVKIDCDVVFKGSITQIRNWTPNNSATWLDGIAFAAQNQRVISFRKFTKCFSRPRKPPLKFTDLQECFTKKTRSLEKTDEDCVLLFRLVIP